MELHEILTKLNDLLVKIGKLAFYKKPPILIVYHGKGRDRVLLNTILNPIISSWKIMLLYTHFCDYILNDSYM